MRSDASPPFARVQSARGIAVKVKDVIAKPFERDVNPGRASAGKKRKRTRDYHEERKGGSSPGIRVTGEL